MEFVFKDNRPSKETTLSSEGRFSPDVTNSAAMLRTNVSPGTYGRLDRDRCDGVWLNELARWNKLGAGRK